MICGSILGTEKYNLHKEAIVPAAMKREVLVGLSRYRQLFQSQVEFLWLIKCNTVFALMNALP
jgi:hypothetical protein